jgi:hypothetical protein
MKASIIYIEVQEAVFRVELVMEVVAVLGSFFFPQKCGQNSQALWYCNSSNSCVS